MQSTRRRAGRILLVATALAIVVAGCGSSGSSHRTVANTGRAASPGAAATIANTVQSLPAAPTASSAAAAGVKAAGREGKSVKLPKETIGIVNVLFASEAAQRLQKGTEQAAAALGWKVSAVDAAGDPTKEEADMVTFVNEHVAAIVDISNATAAITQGLAQARAKKIPVINIGGLQNSSPNIEAQYYGDPIALTAALDKYMFAHLPAHPKVVEFTSQIEYDEQKRDAQFQADAKAAGATVYTYPIDLANLAGDAVTSAHAALQAHPGINAFWGDIDGEFPLVAQVLKGAGKCGKIGVYNFYDDLINLKTIAGGCATAIVTSPPEADGWAAIDQLAEYFARHKSITSFPPTWTQLQSEIYGVDIRTGSALSIVTKANLPAAGKYVTPKTDYPAFFLAKWKKEYGVS